MIGVMDPVHRTVLACLVVCAAAALVGCGTFTTSTAAMHRRTLAQPHGLTTGRPTSMARYEMVEPYRIELHIAGQVRLLADSQAGTIHSRRASLPDLGVTGYPTDEIIFRQPISESQHIGLARWTARFLDSNHPPHYPTRASGSWVGATSSWVRVGDITVRWDNTADAPELRAQIDRLLDLTEGRITTATGFVD